ncbi:MAG TPA: hypothetical protein VGC10_04755 [Sphingomonas sp.]
MYYNSLIAATRRAIATTIPGAGPIRPAASVLSKTELRRIVAEILG